MGDLDPVVGDHEQTGGHQGLHGRRRGRVIAGQRVGRETTPDDPAIPVLGGQAKQDPTGSPLLLVGQARPDLLGAIGEGPDDAARLLVPAQVKPSITAAVPRPHQRGGQVGQDAGLVGGFDDDGLDEVVVAGQAGPPGALPHDHPHIVLTERTKKDRSCDGPIGQARIGAELGPEVGPHAQHQARPGAHTREEGVDESPPLRRVGTECEQLLELVDDEQRAPGQTPVDRPLARWVADTVVCVRSVRLVPVHGAQADQWALARGHHRDRPPLTAGDRATTDRRHQTGQHQRGLAVARRAGERDDTLAAEHGERLGQRPVPPDELPCVIFCVGCQAFERADGRGARLRPVSDPDGGQGVRVQGERVSVVQDVAVQSPQGSSGLDPQLLGEHPPGSAVRLQRGRLIARPVVREHELGPVPLVQRVVGNARLQRRDELASRALGQTDVDEGVGHVAAQMLERNRLRGASNQVVVPPEGHPSPQRQRGLAMHSSLDEVTAPHRVQAQLRPVAEHDRVDVLRVHVQAPPVPYRGDHAAGSCVTGARFAARSGTRIQDRAQS